jgi:catalase
VFFVRDASTFQDFIHSQKRRPDTGLHDNNVQWARHQPTMTWASG